ncbi:MAG: hypothetical protein HYR51_11355 [Candidatus Rokubacteria bacterium]|nr:hypothetical protein [Candidatus Rokubacteria bacterium]
MAVNRLSHLARPPRDVPARVRAALLANRLTMSGVLAFGLASAALAGFTWAGDPSADYRLDRDRRETPGVLMGRDGSGEPIRYAYAFAGPDGTRRDGISYAYPGKGVDRDEPITVEYSPSDPHLSRIKGTHVTLYPKGVQLVVIPLLLFIVAAGLVLAQRGLARGARWIRLLRVGELTLATVTTCRLTWDRPGPELPLDEFRARYAERLARAPARRASEVMRGQYYAFAVLGLVVGLAGVATMVWAIAVKRGASMIPVTLFLVAWVLIVGLMIRAALRTARSFSERGTFIGDAILPARTALPRGADPVAVEMTLEFPTRRGGPVRVTGIALLNPRLGEDPTEEVLYDPEAPSDAILLDALPVPLGAGASGGWQRVGPGGALVRMGAMLLALGFGLPVVAWTLWLIARP